MTFRNVSAAVFGQVSWQVTDRLRLLPGLRFNYDQKSVDFDQQVYGGLQTTDPALIALQLSVLAPQQYTADVDDTNLSGQFTAAYKLTDAVNVVLDLLDQLQVGGPEPERRADRRARPAGALGRDGEAGGREALRGGREDRAVPQRDRERHGLQHRHPGLPDAGRQRQRRRAARLPRQRRGGARARRGVRQLGSCQPQRDLLRRGGLHRRRAT